MKYQLRMFYADVPNQTAGSKATRDCSDILSSIGYRHFDVPVSLTKGKVPNLLSLFKRFSLLFASLKKGDIVLLQYPLLGVNHLIKWIVAFLRLKGCRMICLVHDLDSLRQVHHAWTLDQEVSRLSAFDLVIVHNVQMKALLQENGMRTATSCLELFDYLLPENVLEEIFIKGDSRGERGTPGKTIVFAGNLAKSEFVELLPALPALRFRLYGPGYAGQSTEQLQWAGVYDAGELPSKIIGDFGLIWDGNEIDRCSGNLGNYLKYNNPHKASLYLLAQLPLLAPKDTAIGNFIEAHAIGLTVNSLFELPELISNLPDPEYLSMKSNIKGIARKIASGAFLKQALETL
jgi:hypothetical protein